MVNDYITQTFDILNKRNLVTFSLHDIFLMDKTEKKKYNLYEIPFGRDVNIEYQVTIQRNPCLGFGDEIASSQKALEGLTTSFNTLKKNYGGGKALSQEAYKAFEDLKKNLLEQYPPKTDSTPCPDLSSVWDVYNQYVDSVKAIHCVLAQDDSTGGELGLPTDNGKVILMKARQLDRTVSRWLIRSMASSATVRALTRHRDRPSRCSEPLSATLTIHARVIISDELYEDEEHSEIHTTDAVGIAACGGGSCSGYSCYVLIRFVGY